MLRTRYVVADILITEVRRTSQGIRIRINMLTPPNKCIFFSSVSFVLISVIALPTAYSVYILHYNLRVHTDVCDFLVFFCALRPTFSYFLLPYPGMVTASCSCSLCFQVPGTKGTYEYTLLFFHTWYHCCCMPTLWGGCTINNWITAKKQKKQH